MPTHKNFSNQADSNLQQAYQGPDPQITYPLYLEKQGWVPLSWANYPNVVEETLVGILQKLEEQKRDIQGWTYHFMSEWLEQLANQLDVLNELIRMVVVSIACKICIPSCIETCVVIHFLQCLVRSIPDYRANLLDAAFLLKATPETVFRYTPTNFLLRLIHMHWYQMKEEEMQISLLSTIKLVLVRAHSEAFTVGIYLNAVLVDTPLRLMVGILAYFNQSTDRVKVQLLELNDTVVRYMPEDALDEVIEDMAPKKHSVYDAINAFLNNESVVIDNESVVIKKNKGGLSLSSNEEKRRDLLRRNSLFHKYIYSSKISSNRCESSLASDGVSLRWSEIDVNNTP